MIDSIEKIGPNWLIDLGKVLMNERRDAFA